MVHAFNAAVLASYIHTHTRAIYITYQHDFDRCHILNVFRIFRQADAAPSIRIGETTIAQ